MIYRIDSNLPLSQKITLLNSMILELNGKIEQGKFNKNEVDALYTYGTGSRKYARNIGLGNTLGTYTGWTWHQDLTGYSIWKYTPTSYIYNALNQLYFDDIMFENKGEAVSLGESGLSVEGLLTLSSAEVLAEEWAWCYYSGQIYVTLRNTGKSTTEGDYFITSASSATNKQNYFIYNHQFTSDYKTT